MNRQQKYEKEKENSKIVPNQKYAEEQSMQTDPFIKPIVHPEACGKDVNPEIVKRANELKSKIMVKGFGISEGGISNIELSERYNELLDQANGIKQDPIGTQNYIERECEQEDVFTFKSQSNKSEEVKQKCQK